MCGIVAYIGKNEAYPIIINGLKRLEYRGYDSAGVAIYNNNELKVFKKQGKVADLEKHVQGEDLQSNIGIGHTRWATHGIPNDENAHPHFSNQQRIAMIHNGIIENYSELKDKLVAKGNKFLGDTDSEVLVHYIESVQDENNCTLSEAVHLALKDVIGAYVIVLMSKDDPNTLIAARKGSPLVLGIGKDEFILASDATPIVEYTKDVIYVQDQEVVHISNGILTLKNIDGEVRHPEVKTLDLEVSAIEKSGYDHFMIKEITEQPEAVSSCLRGRIYADKSDIDFAGNNAYLDILKKADRIIIIACGTSYHAGLVGEYLFEDLVRIPVEVEFASEFRYRNPVVKENDVVIAISQSGETADTLVAIEQAKLSGAKIFSICNAVGASIPRASDYVFYTQSGPEISVASTKAFTGQLTMLSMLAIKASYHQGFMSQERFLGLIHELDNIPSLIKEIMKSEEAIKQIALKYKDYSSFLYLGRGYNYPVALEGALKLKEISYIHAEGYAAAEMKHGPIALIDENLPVVFIATKDKAYEKIVSNIQEVKARKGMVLSIVTQGDELVPKMSDEVIIVPAVDEVLMPLISVIPLQLLSYHVGVGLGLNVDQPRNLAKSVTVE